MSINYEMNIRFEQALNPAQLEVASRFSAIEDLEFDIITPRFIGVEDHWIDDYDAIILRQWLDIFTLKYQLTAKCEIETCIDFISFHGIDADLRRSAHAMLHIREYISRLVPEDAATMIAELHNHIEITQRDTD